MRYKKEARGKPLDPEKGRSILDKLFLNRDQREIAREEGVAHSTVYKLATSFPLFFRNPSINDD